MVIETFYSPEHEEQLERVACPVCGGVDLADYRVAHDRLFGRPGQYRVARCSACSMTFTNPRPTFASLGRHYPKNYFCYDPPETLRGLRRFVLSAVSSGLVDRRIQMTEKAIGALGPGTRVCDVGCGYGALLLGLRDRRACDVTGVDFNPDMVTYGETRGLPVHLGTLGEARFDDSEFDVVTMTEYLEHEGDPRTVLEECRRVLKPGGHVVIEVPCISALGARLFGNFWSQLDLPRHLMFFTPKTLGRMLNDTGFEVVTVRSAHGSIAMSLLHLFGYENIGEMSALDIILTAIATIPLLPFLPFLGEFMFVVARLQKPALLGQAREPELVPERSASSPDFGVAPELPSAPRAA